MKAVDTPGALHYCFSKISYSWIYIAFCLFASLIASGQPDSTKSSNITLSTNTLSFIAGHVGPEFRVTFPSKTYNRKYVIGYRLAYGTRGFDSPFPEDDLTLYKQSLRMANDLTFGIQYNFLSTGFEIMPMLTFGRFAYGNTQTVCLKSIENDTSILGYCACEEVGVNSFTEVAYRTGLGLELQYTFLTLGKWSIGASGSMMWSIVFRERQGYLRHDTCSDLNGVGDFGQEPVWGEEASFLLHNIPYTTNQRREESSSILVARVGLWVNYQF